MKADKSLAKLRRILIQPPKDWQYPVQITLYANGQQVFQSAYHEYRRHLDIETVMEEHDGVLTIAIESSQNLHLCANIDNIRFLVPDPHSIIQFQMENGVKYGLKFGRESAHSSVVKEAFSKHQALAIYQKNQRIRQLTSQIQAIKSQIQVQTQKRMQPVDSRLLIALQAKLQVKDAVQVQPYKIVQTQPPSLDAVQKLLDLVIQKHLQQTFQSIYPRRDKVYEVAHLTALIGRYMQVPMRFPMNLRQSDGTVYDYQDQEHPIQEVYFLNKNIEVLLSHLDVRVHTLELSNVNLVEEVVCPSQQK